MRPPFPSNRGGHGQRPGQGAVRVNQLEQTLASFDREIGAKFTVILTQFHTKYVRPLEERIAYLEALPHRKVWYQLGRLWMWARSFVHVERTDQQLEQAGGVGGGEGTGPGVRESKAETANLPVASDPPASPAQSVGGAPLPGPKVVGSILDASGDPVQEEGRDD